MAVRCTVSDFPIWNNCSKTSCRPNIDGTANRVESTTALLWRLAIEAENGGRVLGERLGVTGLWERWKAPTWMGL
jgi:hypothetical protein